MVALRHSCQLLKRAWLWSRANKIGKENKVLFELEIQLRFSFFGISPWSHKTAQALLEQHSSHGTWTGKIFALLISQYNNKLHSSSRQKETDLMRHMERVKLNQNLEEPEQDPFGFVPAADHRLALPSLALQDHKNPLVPAAGERAVSLCTAVPSWALAVCWAANLFWQQIKMFFPLSPWIATP